MSDAVNVFDSSVLIAVLNHEAYDPYVLDMLEDAIMSTVNCAEVWTKLQEFGLTDDPRIAAIFSLLARIVPFSEAQARLTGDLRHATRHRGLSLGDRACLALAIEEGATAYTTEGKWLEVDLPCAVRKIR